MKHRKKKKKKKKKRHIKGYLNYKFYLIFNLYKYIN